LLELADSEKESLRARYKAIGGSSINSPLGAGDASLLM